MSLVFESLPERFQDRHPLRGCEYLLAEFNQFHVFPSWELELHMSVEGVIDNLSGPRSQERPPELALFARSCTSKCNEESTAQYLGGDSPYSILPPSIFCIKLEVWGHIAMDGHDGVEQLFPSELNPFFPLVPDQLPMREN